jgi:hypothetical protein
MSAIVETRRENALATWYQTVLFFPPISVIAPSSAERFDKQLGASAIDLKARLKCPRSGLADEIKHAVSPAFPLAERFFPIAP